METSGLVSLLLDLGNRVRVPIAFRPDLSWGGNVDVLDGSDGGSAGIGGEGIVSEMVGSDKQIQEAKEGKAMRGRGRWDEEETMNPHDDTLHVLPVLLGRLQNSNRTLNSWTDEF